MIHRSLKYITASIWLSFVYLVSRPGSAIVTVIAFSASVVVFLSMFALRQSYAQAFSNSGSNRIAVILSSGVKNETDSMIPARLISDINQISGTSGSNTSFLLAPEIVSSLRVEYKSTNIPATILFRGITPGYWRMHPFIRVVAGRSFNSGVDEVIVGKQATLRFKNLQIGDYVKAADRRWQIVGEFTANHSLFESEVWTDSADLQDALHLGNNYSALLVELADARSIGMLRKRLNKIPNTSISVVSEKTYYKGQAAHTLEFMSLIAIIITAVMGVSATLTSANILRNAIRTRTRDMATLGALGYSRSFIAGFLIIENVTLGLLGGTAASVIIYFTLNHREFSTMNFGGSLNSSYQIAFNISIATSSITYSILYAVVISILGAFPAIYKALKTPIALQIRDN